MSQPLAPEGQGRAVLRFYVTPRQPISPGILLVAFVLALACLVAVRYALARSRHANASPYGSGTPQFGATGSGDSSAADDDDDPSRVDTIYLGGPDEAPVATRPQGQPSTVHPFVVVRLPRAGDQVGRIPDTPAGRLLYAWLAAFNGTHPAAALAKALPTPESGLTQAAQVELRRETGGFTLLSAVEVQPGVLVFRLHDQTPSETEVLGTLQVRPNSSPASIASFSLRAVAPPQAKGH